MGTCSTCGEEIETCVACGNCREHCECGEGEFTTKPPVGEP